MTIKIQTVMLLILGSVCCSEVFSQIDTLKLSDAHTTSPNLSVGDSFPEADEDVKTQILWVQKLSDESTSIAPVIFKSKVLVANSSKCYDLFSGKPMRLESDSSKELFAKSFIQIPFNGLLKLYSQGKLIGTYETQTQLAAGNSEKAFGFGNYKVMCLDHEGREVWSINHPKRIAGKVWLKEDLIMALRPPALSSKESTKELIVLDYNGNIKTIVNELRETPDFIIQSSEILFVGSYGELFCLDTKKNKIIWRIDQRIEQKFSLHKGRLVSASLVLDPLTGNVLEKYPRGVHGEWKLWNNHFITRVFDGDEYNDFLCEESPRKYYYISYGDLRSYEPFKHVSLTGNYPQETIGETTAAIFKGSDGFYLVGLKVNFRQ